MKFRRLKVSGKKLKHLIVAGVGILAVVAVIFGLVTKLPTAPRQGADIYLGFNEGYGTTVSETVASAVTGTITGAVWRTEDLCLSGKCLFFDGSGDYVTFGDDSDYDFTASANWTISVWIRHAPKTSGTDVIIAKTNASAGYKLYMESDGDITFAIDDDATWTPDASVSSTAATYDDNRWHHIAAVKTGTTKLELYIDGLLVGTNASISGVGDLTNSANFYIGVDGNGSSNYFTGFIDELKVYTTTAKTADQIKTDTLRTSSSAGVAASFGPDNSYLSDGLVGYWPMDEKTPDTCSDGRDNCDYSGNDNNAFWSGATSGSGKFGSGVSLNGSSNYVVIGDVSEANISLPFTLSAWFKIDTLPSTKGTNEAIVSKYGPSPNREWLLDIGTNDVLYFWKSHNGTNGTYPFTYGYTLTSADVNVWRQVIVTGDSNGNMNLYIDGELIDSATLSNLTFYTGGSASMQVGEAEAGGRFFDGNIDEPRIYNRALSPAEAQDLYNWAPGPVGYWKMDEQVSGDSKTIYDSSGNGNNGTTYDGANNTGMDCSVTGKYSSACEFDGIDDYITVADSTSFLVDDTNNFSAMFWIYANTLGDDDIFYKRTSYGTMDWGLYYGGGFQLFLGESNADRVFYSDGVTLSTKTWHHVAFSKEGTTYRLYVDGILKSTDTSSQTWTNSDDFTFGTDDPGSTGDFDGKLDDIKIYNYARTPAQIVEDMNAGHPAPGSPVGSALGHWKFDEGYGTTAHDAGFGNNDLTLSSASWTNSGKYGKAFNGTGSTRMSMADNSDFDFGTSTDFSVSTWVFIPTGSDGRNIISKGDDSGGGDGTWGFDHHATNNLNFFVSPADATWCTIKSNSPLTKDTWHHVVAVVKRNSSCTTNDIVLYDNGQQMASSVIYSSANTNSNLDNDDPLYVGYKNGSSYFTGYIDELKIYNLAMTADQVKTEFNQGVATVFGAGRDADGNVSYSAASEYCVPGDGSTCSPPVAEWKFDEKTGQTINDSSGNGLSGTLGLDTSVSVNDPTWKVGKIGSALQFDGVNDYARVANNDLLKPPDDMTLSLWFKLNTLPSVAGEAFYLTHKLHSTGPIYSSYRAYVSNDNDQVVFYWCNATACSNNNGFSSFGLQTHTWYHANFIKEGTITKIYVNGIQDIDPATGATGDILNSDNWLYFGGNVSANQSWLDGSLDDVRLYDYARTPAQIAWEYNRGEPVAWWKYDDNVSGNSQTLNDSSGNNISATTYYGANSSGMDCTVAGKRGLACSFDGTDDYAATSTLSLLYGTYYDLSWGAWFYPSSSPTSDTLIRKGLGFKLTTNSEGKPQCEIYYSSAWHTIASSDTALPASAWSHLICTYDGEYGKLYLNGKEINRVAETNGITYSSLSAVSVARDLSGSGYFHGLVDDVKIWNYALTAKQIETEYNGGAVKF